MRFPTNKLALCGVLTALAAIFSYVEAMIPTPINQITASDHLNFWKFGYKAIMVTDTAHFRNPNYHTANDTLETLDVNKMQCVVNLVVESIKEMTKNKDFFN